MNTVAIFMAGQQGDIMSALSVMRYRKELWGDDCKIVWFAAKENFDIFKYQDIEVREFPRGFGYPQMVYEENKKLVDAGKEPIWEDWLPLVDEKNHMNLALKNNFPSLADIDYGYFPAPHQIPVNLRHGWDYPVCSKKIFGVPDNYEWHPVINFSDEERQEANDFMKDQMPGRKVIIESFAGSGQSLLDEAMIEKSMALCEERWVDCNFIFASHKFLRNNEKFPAYFFKQAGVYSCANFTVRQCALIAEQCDLMISVSSGITVASSAWGIKQPPTIQYTGSFICSTKSLANGHFELVTYDDKSIEQSKEVFYNTLEKLLIQYK